jgi:hypothetical protein
MLAGLLMTQNISSAIKFDGKREPPPVGNDVIFFGRYPNDHHIIVSTIGYSFEHYRKSLGLLMKDFDAVIMLMDEQDDRFPGLQSVHDEFRHQASTLPELWEVNENSLRFLVDPFKLSLRYGICDSGPTCTSFASSAGVVPHSKGGDNQGAKKSNDYDSTKSAKIPSYDTLEQVLIHLSRDWGERGRRLREQLYDNGIVSKLVDYLPLSLPSSSQESKAVLVPGAGLGRLAVEIAARGFR